MDIKKFLILIVLLLGFIPNVFAGELNIEKIETPIIFEELVKMNEEAQAAKELERLLYDIDFNESIYSISQIDTDNNIEKGVLKEEVTKTELGAQKRTLKEILKGEKAPNALLFAMYSVHTSDDKDSKNGQQDLIGLQYDGKVFMYFRNSFYHATVIGGVARDIYRKQLTENTKFDFGYKAGLMYGYHEEYPNLLGLTPAILPMFGLTYKGKGIDLYVVPDFSPTFIFNVRWELPNKKV